MNLYQHFRSDEHPFIDRISEWIQAVSERHQQKRTDFLDPRQAYILSTIAAGEPDIVWELDGGDAAAERKRAVLAPHYDVIEREDFGLAVVSFTSADQRFSKISHGDVLGALLGLGIKREKLGDIYLHNDYCHCVVAEEIAPFIHLHLHQVHRVQVTTELISIEQLHALTAEYEEMDFTVASLRLDGILSEAARISRSKIMAPIRSGACKVNWKVEQNPAAELGEGDVVSFKGFGRYRILRIEGQTRKGRIRVKVGKFL